jgi:hypothetical protein
MTLYLPSDPILGAGRVPMSAFDTGDAKMKHGMLLSLTLWALIAYAVTGCSAKIEFGYHGQTGRDDRVQTQLTRKPANDDRRY